MRKGIFALILLLAGHAHATGEINVLTDLMSPFPPGCIAVALPNDHGQSDLLINEDVMAPSVGSSTMDSVVNVQVWRVGCHDEDFSIVMVRLQTISRPDESYVLVPQAWVDVGIVDVPFHSGQLIRHPAVGEVSAAGDGAISDNGTTFMLGVDPISFDGVTEFLPEDYNDVFTLELYWGDFAPDVAPDGKLFFVDEYLSAFDLPQTETQLLHGRMAGGYGFEGIPSTGMHLSVGERADDTNFISIIFFTYLDGMPFWLIGNAPNLPEMAPGAIEVDMFLVTGGEFFGLGPDVFTNEDIDVEVVGSVMIDPIDCNTLLVGHNFDGLGLSSDVLVAFRQINIAGYTCNPWVAID
jgi:hypothetical protein